MARYKRLDVQEREEISRLVVLNCSHREIASILERSHSTIYREVVRGWGDKQGSMSKTRPTI